LIGIPHQLLLKFCVGLLFYAPPLWFGITIFITESFAYLYITFYLILSFQQVKESMTVGISDQTLQYLLREHDRICDINYRNNILLSKIMFILYFFNSWIIDMELHLAIYIDIFFYKLLLIGVVCVVILIITSLTMLSAYLSKQAHSPYSKLNSMMAKRSLPWRKN
jgi:hypothetical protein